MFELKLCECINILENKEVRQMSNKCEICGKGQVSGNNVSHANRHTKRKWNANIQTVRINGLKLVFRLAKEVAIFLDAHAARIEILAKQRL